MKKSGVVRLLAILVVLVTLNSVGIDFTSLKYWTVCFCLIALIVSYTLDS